MFEDIIGVIRSCSSKVRGYSGKLKMCVNSCAPEGFVVPAPLVAPVMLLFNNTVNQRTDNAMTKRKRVKGSTKHFTEN